ncbi:hypothetical protein ACOME3_001758 [Neoechinorhynchus agilis]
MALLCPAGIKFRNTLANVLVWYAECYIFWPISTYSVSSHCWKESILPRFQLFRLIVTFSTAAFEMFKSGFFILRMKCSTSHKILIRAFILHFSWHLLFNSISSKGNILFC